MFKFLVKSYSSLKGHLFALIGIAVSGIPIYFNMDKTISIKLFLPICIIIFFITSILVRALHLAATKNNLPRIRKGLEANKPYSDFSFLLLTDPYKLFTFNTLITVFSMTDDVEELIGTGRVLNVQLNGMLLIGVLIVEDKENVSKSVVQNNQETLNKLIIKPMVEI